jgi:type I restriction enzyme R subunit
MIEFKQIIGRGTRLYDGKDYFTILDFVKAYQHFSDPEWDGEPPEPQEINQRTPGLNPDPPERDDDPKFGDEPEAQPRRTKLRIKLGDGKERSIQHMLVTSFWHPDGKPMSSQQFIELLYGQLPEFVRDEAELRALWSSPDTRSNLLQGLAEKGFGAEQLAEMQAIISAEHSDLFDVLAHVAYALPPIPRETRAQQARLYIHSRFSSKQQLFLDFVLQHYVSSGVQELAQEKLTPLLRLRYQNSIADAVADLGKPEEIGQLFSGFQRFLRSPNNWKAVLKQKSPAGCPAEL